METVVKEVEGREGFFYHLLPLLCYYKGMDTHTRFQKADYAGPQSETFYSWLCCIHPPLPPVEDKIQAFLVLSRQD